MSNANRDFEMPDALKMLAWEKANAPPIDNDWTKTVERLKADNEQLQAAAVVMRKAIERHCRACLADVEHAACMPNCYLLRSLGMDKEVFDTILELLK
jgi:hypothetical protein